MSFFKSGNKLIYFGIVLCVTFFTKR